MGKTWEKETDNYIFFYGGIFSNWYPAIFHSNFSADGELIEFGNSEQYMMAAKAMLFGDEETYELIMQNPDPGTCKVLGRQVKNFNEKIWLAKARDIVYVGVYDKFYQNDDLMNLMMSTTGKTIVEASPSDRLWGIGLRCSDYRCAWPNRWLGRNWLGQVIMKVRDDIGSSENNSFEEINWSSSM